MAKNSAKNVQDEIKDSAQKIWLAGLGALAAAEEEGGKLFNRLVSKGETVQARTKKTVAAAKDKVEDVWSEVGSKLDEQVSGTLHRLGVPGRDEIRKLTKRVEELAAKVEQLASKATKAPAKKATRG